MLRHHQLTDAIDLARQTITTLGPDPRLADILLKAEREVEFREQKKQRQAKTLETARALLNEGKLSDATLLLKDAVETKLFSFEDPQIKALFEEIGARRYPPAAPGVPSEPKVPTASLFSDITVVPPVADPAKDYVYMGGTAQRDAPAYAEHGGEGGGLPIPGAGRKPLQSSSPPAAESETVAPRVMPPSSEVEGKGKEHLNLQAMEKHLVISLGPMANIIVQRAAAKAKDEEELFTLLASTLPSQKDREAFLARKKEFLRSQAQAQKTKGGSVAGGEKESRVHAPRSAELSPANIRGASELLARYLGPISGILTERAAQRADSLHGLYMILADYLKDNSERTQFLRKAGFPQA